MDMLQKDDVPYGDDWDNDVVVADWAKVADQKRPWRAEIRLIRSGPGALNQRSHRGHRREAAAAGSGS
jgi:hypothetical protein